MSKMILEIEGMSCTHCVNHVKNTLIELEGVDKVISVEIGKAIIDGDISEDDLRDALEDEGFELVSVD